MKLSATIVQGDDVSFVINVKDKTKTAINLTGVTAITFIAQKTICGDEYISKTLGSGVTVTDAAAGQITVTLTDTDTSDDNLPAGDYYFELQITDSSGNISTVRSYNDELGILKVLADLDQ